MHEKRKHPSFERLLAAAKDKGVNTRESLAGELDQTTFTINNWVMRGVSKDGALAAEQAFGCFATWVLSGKMPNDPPYPQAPKEKDEFARLKTIYFGLPPHLRVKAMTAAQEAMSDLIPPYTMPEQTVVGGVATPSATPQDQPILGKTPASGPEDQPGQ